MPIIDVILGDAHGILDLKNDQAIMHLTGNWDGANSARLKMVFSRVVDRLQGQLVLSLEGCRAFDSQAMGFLVYLRNHLEELHRPLVLVDVPEAILGLLESQNLLALFSLTDSRDTPKALAA